MNRHLIALHQRQAKRQAAFAASPAGQAAQAAALRRDALANLQRIRVDAGSQAIRGDNPAAALQAAGRVAYIACRAAMLAGMSGDEPELRILRGAASALGDVHAQPAALDQHRGAIISGLQAADRLWPHLTPAHLIAAYVDIEEKLSSPAGLSLSDFERTEA